MPVLASERIGDLLKQLLALLILIGFGVVLYVAWRRRRLALTFIAVAIVFAALWGLAYAAISTDYRDADGFTDCWPRCSVFQTLVGGTFFLAPAMFFVLGILAITLGAISALRGRESHPRG